MKVADLGNACWASKHYTSYIQTRPYRAIEVIIGAKYSYSADIWSIACMTYELATGQYLFHPHSSRTHDKDESQLELILALLGPLPSNLTFEGKFFMDFFTEERQLRKRPHKPRSIQLHKLLKKQLHLSMSQAIEMASFLYPMLIYEPRRRASAIHCLKHPWLAKVPS